jgi:hypothetical protein
VRGLRFRIAAALIALALPFAAATVAAAPASADKDEWSHITCLSGAIDSSTLTHTADGPLVNIEGHLDCAPPADGNTYYYGIASYRAGDTSGRAGLAEYTSLTPPTNFSFGGLVGRSLEDIGVCAVTDYSVRVACVRIQMGRGGIAQAVTPLAVDAPLVDKPIGVITNYDGKLPGATCATCW